VTAAVAISQRYTHSRLSARGRGYLPGSMALVHRTKIEDVFAVGWKRLGEAHFSVLARLPHNHGYFAPTADRTYDMLLLIETMRQASIMVSHSGLGVPLDHHFMLSKLEISCHPERLAMAREPVETEIDVALPEVKYRSGQAIGFTCLWTMRRDGETMATGLGCTRFTSPRVYGRLREGRLTPATSSHTGTMLLAHRVGRHRESDVLLSPSREQGHGQWQLSLDTDHPTLFQHPVDHIPGMVLLEAARQAAVAFAPAPFVPTTASISFQRYAEFGSPFILSAEDPRVKAGGRDAAEVHVVGSQNGGPVFTCSVGARPQAARRASSVGQP
jgi:hypothetical protein